MSLITLTTDFGESSPYVACMKGVILSITPSTSIFDLSHQIPPQDLRHAAYFIATAIPYFPSRSIHVVVVDPGVGMDRAILLAKLEAQYVLVPDNGVATLLFDRHPPTKIWKLTETRFWRGSISDTFHGRDIFAPVAGNLALERRPERFGEAVTTWVRLPGQPFLAEGNRIVGSIQFVDHFGNLITNIPSRALSKAPARLGIAGQTVEDVNWVRTYGEAAAGNLIGLKSSDGFVEIAVVHGSAADRLSLGAGTSVEIDLPK